jgi:hypothetical protein
MVPVEAAVNSSMLLTIHCSIERLSRLVWRVSCAIRRASVSTNRLVVQRNKRCVQMHNSLKRAISCCHPAIALKSPDRSRQESPGKAPSR